MGSFEVLPEEAGWTGIKFRTGTYSLEFPVSYTYVPPTSLLHALYLLTCGELKAFGRIFKRKWKFSWRIWKYRLKCSI